MRKLLGFTEWFALLALFMLAAVAFGVSSAGAAVTVGAPASAVLSSQPGLGTTSTLAIADDGSGVTSLASNVELDTADTTAAVGSDGYLCGNVAYHATVRATSLIGITVFTYRETFGVHVCHDKVTAKNALYGEPMDSAPGWTWCGDLVQRYTLNPNAASAIGYDKGCFTLAYKIGQTKYPWGSITIGGNGNLWARSYGG